MGPLLLRFGGLLFFCNTLRQNAHFCILICKTHMFCSVSLFSLFFHLDFLTKPLQITANSYFRRVSCWWNAHLCANHIIYYVPGTIFPRRPAPGRVSLERCANFTFSFFVFSFWPLFFILFFGLSDVLDSYQITAFGSRRPNLWPSLGGLRGARREPICIEKTIVFAYFH